MQKSKSVKYSCGNFYIEEEYQLIKGHKAKVVRIVETDAVVILPLTDSGKIILERQYRPSIKKTLYELPAGHIRKGENKKEAVRRELGEETGYTAEDVSVMFHSYPTPGNNVAMHHFYLARGLSKGKKHQDEDEVISNAFVSIAEAINMVRDNKIIDTKTIAALAYYKLFRCG
jgi:ADP-ribose pyrophosphatase